MEYAVFIFLFHCYEFTMFFFLMGVVYILTSRASDKCQREKRKTINGDDLLWAMTTLGFEEYVEPLKFYLTRYREVCGNCGDT